MVWSSFRPRAGSRVLPCLRLGLVMMLALPFALWLLWPSGPPALPPPVELDGAVPVDLPLAQSAAAEAELAPAGEIRKLEIKRGDTLMKLLLDAGASRAEAHRAIAALTERFDPRRLKPGQSLRATFVPAASDTDDQARRLAALSLRPDPEHDVVVALDSAGEYAARIVARPLRRELAVAEGRIDLSLFLAGRAAAVPPPVMVDLIRIFSFDVDFQREIQPGDHFELLYDSYRIPPGASLGTARCCSPR